MSELKCLSWLLTCTSLISLCTSQDSIGPIIQTLDKLQEEMHINKVDMIRMEKRILDFIEVAKTSLRAELKENIQGEVRKAMVEILQGEFLHDMLKRQVVSDLLHLKHSHHQMKRQLHRVSSSFNETAVFQESLLKKTDLWNRENSSDICIREKHTLEIELQKAGDTTTNLTAIIKVCTALRKTCQSQMSQLITNLTVSACTPANVNATQTSAPSVPSTPTSTPPRTPVILVAAVWSNIPHQFHQIDIHGNFTGVYPYLNMRKLTYVAYARKTRKLLMGVEYPDAVLTSTLSTSDVAVLREGVRTYGIAVDEGRDIIFITTLKPLDSISRMSPQGKDFTAIIDLTKYSWHPRHLTLDTKRKRIYWCNYLKLFTMTYDGKGLATLATGDQVYAVTLDQTAGVLYYNDANKPMKKTVSSNVTTRVAILNADPWNMRLYRNTIYYSSYDSRIVGILNVTYSPIAHSIHLINIKDAHSLLMCLIP
ncbi:uncharacterized protein [Haliotis asinina]|uniref:uncharacterized protein n=1 Tax=Haliotis asinina TaxID=109174 RepID=UPI0035322938